MFNKNLIIASILTMFAFAGSTLAQDRITTKITKTKKPNVEQATNQRPKQNRVPGNNPNARKSGGKGTKGFNPGDTGTHEYGHKSQTSRKTSPGSNIGKPQKGKYVPRPKSVGYQGWYEEAMPPNMRSKKPSKPRRRNK